MTTTPRRKADSDLVSVEEFFCLVPDGQKADLIDGVIYMASPDTRRSDRLGGWIKFLLQGYAAVKGLGEVYGSRFAFELTEFRAPEPDVAFVCAERLTLVDDRRMVGGPDIAVEAVSRDSRQRDYGEKKQLYADAGVAEYWIIDPLQQRCEFIVCTRDATNWCHSNTIASFAQRSWQDSR